jgi:hypothetical protein
MTDYRPTDEQLTVWVEDMFEFPVYYQEDLHDGYIQAMARELLELRRALNSVALEEAQRPSLGMRDIADTLAFLAMKTVNNSSLIYLDAEKSKLLRREFTDTFEDLLNRLPEGAIAEVHEALADGAGA